MSYRFLRLNRGGTVGGFDHLQDPPKLPRSPRNAKLGPQLWSSVRDSVGCLPLILPRNGQGLENVPSQVSLKFGIGNGLRKVNMLPLTTLVPSGILRVFFY